MTIYFLSGLGADERMFQKLTLHNHFTIKYIKWIPNIKNESLASYANRLLPQINIAEPFQLIGFSFGGIIATEISKIIQPKQITIISSVSTYREIPWYYKFAERIKIQKIIPNSFFKSPTNIFFWLLGAKSNEQKKLLTQILIDTDGDFLKWAIEKIASWDNKIKAENLYQIHGTEDKLLPIKYINPDRKIIGGGHLMVYDKDEEISEILNELILGAL